uniref:S-adenosylmethionine mitochondrial carrier protein n=1 Tax=Angiostrongylus cantonensis TaxID=6313 RepID=A0A0K0DJR0_ANGCA
MNEDLVRWLVCGAGAGLAVDLGLYPLDTMKTRLQSKQGFVAAGGFRNLYRHDGMGPVAVGSAPGAALFFLNYRLLNSLFSEESAFCHAVSASFAEAVACLVRVPTEIVKQRLQASNHERGLRQVCREIYRSGRVFGFYRGYLSTIAREIPFSVIEFPLWEFLKTTVASRKGTDCSPLEGAACGSIAGSFAAAITTPFDVAKTRIMLSNSEKTPTIWCTLKEVYSHAGFLALFSGITPRVLWMAAGGFIFFGVYETALALSYWAYSPYK